MPSFREARVLVDHRGSVRRVCKLAFSHQDASLYLFPYAACGSYYYGGRSLTEAQFQDTFDFTKEFSANSIPKLSIHESGQVHVGTRDKRAGPLQIPSLDTLTGQHVATVCPDMFSALPLFNRRVGLGPELDVVINASELAANARVAIFMNGQAPEFDGGRCRLTIAMRRPTLQNPLYMGIRAIAQEPLIEGDSSTGGTTVLAGWNPLAADDSAIDLLYVRGR